MPVTTEYCEVIENKAIWLESLLCNNKLIIFPFTWEEFKTYTAKNVHCIKKSLEKSRHIMNAY